MFPTAIHVAVAVAIRKGTAPGPGATARRARGQSRAVGQDHQDRPHASGRRHAADAWARKSAVSPGRWSCRSTRARQAQQAVLELPVGGTAVGTGINTHPEFGRRVAEAWPRRPESPSSRRPIISRPTPSATAWSNATASCGPSPRRCSTWPTTSAGWAPARAAVFTRCSSPTASRAARSCPAR